MAEDTNIMPISKKLCEIANEEIGTDEIIRIRRKADEISGKLENECYRGKCSHDHLWSGSRAESFSFPTSDADCMVVYNNVQVTTDNDIIKPCIQPIINTIVKMETDQTRPGFCLLRFISQERFHSLDVTQLCVRIQNGLYLTNTAWKDKLKHFIQDSDTHGPCETGIHGSLETDVAHCVKCKWPKSAYPCLQKLLRTRWPSVHHLSEIVKNGCHIVPIGDKTSYKEFIEWRISFSEAEKALIHQMNHCQFLTYGLLKLFLKGAISTCMRSDVDGLLCSFFLKTTVMWEIVYGGPMWREHDLLKWFRCREETKPCPQIYQEVVSGLRNPKWDDDTQRMVERLPTYQSCHNVLHQQRSKLLPKLPTTQADLVLQGEWTETTVGERFLLTDSNDAGRRIIIYATDSNLELLTNCSTIYGDGTFYVCPGVFNQLYSLHGCVDGHFYPFVFAFLPGKSTDVYLRFWDLLKSACDDRGLQLEPATVFLDFESAMHSATRSAFPSVTLKGCFFHFTQCVWRKAQQTGLQIPYQQNDAIKLLVRRAAALPLVPLDRIEDVWEFALQELWDTDFPVARTEPFVDYVTEQWVDRDRLVWNHFNSDGPRTTNHLEGWHSKIKKQVQIAHPNMYQIIRHLKQIQASNEISIVQIRAGGLPKPKKRKYRNIDSRIRNLQRRLQASEIDVFEYVDEVSQLIHLG